MNIVMCVPTVADENGVWRREFLGKCVPSMKCLLDEGFRFTLCLNMQQYDDRETEDVYRAIDAVGVPALFKARSYSPPVCMRKVREQTVPNQPFDAILCADDDMVYRPGAGKRYRAVARYMRDNPQCGVVMCMGSMGGAGKGDAIYPATEQKWWTNRGLFLRAVSGVDWRFCPQDSNHIPGTIEELYAVYARFALGYTGAKTFNVPVTHRAVNVEDFDEFKKGNGRKGRYVAHEDIHRPDWNRRMMEFIGEKWSDPVWKFGTRLPSGLVTQMRKSQRKWKKGR